MTKTFKLMIKCIYHSKDKFEKIKEENRLRDKLAKLLYEEKYNFLIAGEDILISPGII